MHDDEALTRDPGNVHAKHACVRLCLHEEIYCTCMWLPAIGAASTYLAAASNMREAMTTPC